MTYPEPTIRVNVDVTNPGQFFACCGLLELADRLWPGAEGWFDDGAFCISSTGGLTDLLSELADSQINSSVTDAGLKRLGTLLSAEKAQLTPEQAAEKETLRESWAKEQLIISAPFRLAIDWWRDDSSGAKGLKTWAAKQFVLEIARPLLEGIRTMEVCAIEGVLSQSAAVTGLPFYFDSESNSQNTPRDTGFGLYTMRNKIRTRDAIRPLVELGALIGLQRCRPLRVGRVAVFQYSTWTIPLSPLLASAAVCGAIARRDSRWYTFSMLYRSKYMKAFLPASPSTGVPSHD